MKRRATRLGMKSIRWKIVLIYVLLVFIATTIIGVFIMNQMEDYYVNTLRVNMTNTAREGTLISTLSTFKDLSEHEAECQANVDAWAKNLQEEIFVVDSNYKIVAATSANRGKSALDILDRDILFLSMEEGEVTESFRNITNSAGTLPVMNMAFPIESGEEITGVLYLRSDMSNIGESISQSKDIFIRAMAIALAVTVILGFFIARSITEPINDVTEKAERMTQGDFLQEVSVKSDDEIGQLAQMFNILRIQLGETLSQISNEKSKLETVLRYMADGLIAVDLSDHIIHANTTACQMLKVTEEEAEAGLYDELIRNLNEELTLDVLRRRCEQGPVSDVFENGGFTYAIRFDNYRDEAGNNVGIIMIIQDITERQKLENMQMDFVANVSHELKTPLTTIKSYTETLMDGALEDPQTAQSFLEIIDTEADRMNRLVKDLLQLSRLEHKQESWHKKPGNLVLLLKTAVQKVELTAAAQNQHLNCIFDDGLNLPVNIDRDGIEQVILNVLSNAIKYTQEGGRIDIDAVKAGALAQIIVTDNGMGIPESELSRVFERFFRVDKARSRAMGGTGLGLAISKQIVEEHGGSIELESREGRGTKVSISLPLSVRRGRSNIE